MTFLRDTDTLIYWMKGHSGIEAKALAAGLANTAISIITLSELYYGAHKSSRVEANLQAVERVRQKLAVIDLTSGAAQVFGEIKAQLEKQGQRLDDADLLIAATALDGGWTLITNNTDHFGRIPNLMVENWA